MKARVSQGGNKLIVSANCFHLEQRRRTPDSAQNTAPRVWKQDMDSSRHLSVALVQPLTQGEEAEYG